MNQAEMHQTLTNLFLSNVMTPGGDEIASRINRNRFLLIQKAPKWHDDKASAGAGRREINRNDINSALMASLTSRH